MTTPDADSTVSTLIAPDLLRRTVLIVAGLNLAYFFVEFTVAAAIGSVSLFADSVDFLEDTAVNLLVFWALGWTLSRRALAGKVMAFIICIPAFAAAWQAWSRFLLPEVPNPTLLVLTAGGAIVVNGVCTLLLLRMRHHGGSMGRAAFLAARNDVFINAAIIVMGLVTWKLVSGWPDLILGIIIIALNLGAAREVWQLASEEQLAARALAGEDLDDD